MNSRSPQLNWKTVTKGRRSARSKNSEAVIRKPSSGKKEHVPIKKRRHLFRPSSPQPRTPSLCRQDSSSPQQLSSSPPFEDNEELLYQSLTSVQRPLSSYFDCKFRGTDRPAMIAFGVEFDYEIMSDQTEAKHNFEGDFSGIELLAAAASMDLDSVNAGLEDVIVEDSLLLKSSNASSFATQSKLGSDGYKSENLTVNEDVTGDSLVLNNTLAASQGLLGIVEDGTELRSSSSKVDRRHWDLNTVMDTWDEPNNESVPGNTSKDATDVDVNVEGRHEGSEDRVVSNSGSAGVECSNLKIEENKLKAESPYGTFMNLPSLKDILQEPENVIWETSDQATDKLVDSPAASVEKIDSPAASVEKTDSPAASVEKTDSPDVSVEKLEPPTASIEKIDSTVDVSHDLDTCLDSNGHMVGRASLNKFQEGYDSPYEDGELRGSCLYSWEDNEMDIECVDYESDGRNKDGSDAADLHGSEIVDGGSEGSHGSDRKSLLSKRFSGDESSSSRATKDTRRYFMKDDSENNATCGKNESNEESVVGENEGGGKKRLFDQRDAVDVKVAQVDEYITRTNRMKLQSNTERSSLDATDGMDTFFMLQCRSRHLGGTDSRTERDTCPSKNVSRYRPTHLSERGGVDQWGHWGSRSRHTSTYQGIDCRSHVRIRSMNSDSVDKFGRLDIHGKRQGANCSSKGFYGPSARRSPVERNDCSGVHRRTPVTRCDGSYRRGNHSHIAGREFEENFELNDDTATIVRMPPYTSRRERNLSPCSVGGVHTPLTRKRSRSRSRTHSPVAWHSHRERNLFTRRQIRSPDFRSEARVDKMRVPFLKSTFASDYGEGGYMSPPRVRPSPQRNSRWVDSWNFEDYHIKRQRSPVRVFKRSQRFDSVSSSGHSGRPKSDEYFRPMFRPRRFSFMPSDDRECKFGTSYEDRKRDYRGDMMQRGRHGDGGNLKRFRHTAVADDFETSNTNKEDAVPLR